MRVHVYDKETRQYYKTEAYAIFNDWQKFVVAAPFEGDVRLMPIPFQDVETKNEYGWSKSLIHVVSPENVGEWAWVNRSGAYLLKVKRRLRGTDIRFESYSGYEWLLKDADAMTDLLQGKSVRIDMAIHTANSKLDGWNYVDTRDDAYALLMETYGFHDSVLKSAEYVSGASVDENMDMHFDHVYRLKLTIDSEFKGSIELVFDGLIAFNLRPLDENHYASIDVASILVKDETVFFIDTSVDSEVWEPGCTCVKAYSLRWRFLGRDE